MDDKVSPEKTIYVPSCTIIPSIDISHLSNIDQKSVLENDSLDKSNTFEICRPAANVLQRDKVSIFRTSTREELITWCRLLLHIASGVSLSSFGITSEDGLFLPNASNTFDDLENHPNTQIARSDSKNKKLQQKVAAAVKIATTVKEEERKTATPGSSPACSLRSVRTEESFNEPAAMSKRRSAALQRSNQPAVPAVPSTYKDEEDLKTPTTILIPAEYLSTDKYDEEEEEVNNADAESFVTARFDDPFNNQDEERDEDHPIVIDEYFKQQKDDDAVSIASTSTAKGPASTYNESPHTDQINTPSPPLPLLKKLPSFASTSTNFDDAQSSLYFSSTSAPPSPSLSTTSSIISIPEFPSVIIPQQEFSSSSTSTKDTRLSAAELYKATLTMKLDDDH
jgi:hypothetical protein